jgi:hypothetical protein
MMKATNKRGRPALTANFVERITSAPEGQPVVVKATKSYSLAYHHQCRLKAWGIVSNIVPPQGEREVGTGTVTNIGDSFALVATATGLRRKDERVHKQIVVV